MARSRKNDFGWFEGLIEKARANNVLHSGGQPEYRAVTTAVARSLKDDALEMAVARYGHLSAGWREQALPILVTERERRNRVRQKRISLIAFVTLIAAVAAVAVPFVIRQ